MKLSKNGIKNVEPWERKGYNLPHFDIQKVEKETKANPFWIHFGAGNIFRAFQANCVQNLLNQKIITKGLIVAEGYDYEIIEEMYKPNDNLGILITLKANGTIQKTVVASIAESLTVDSQNKTDWNRIKEIFSNKSLQMATFTITEKGYLLKNASGVFMPGVQDDLKAGPENPSSYMGKIVSLLYTRFVNGKMPLAFVSMDNCSHNGDKLYNAVNEFAKAWEKNNVCKKGFVDYINSDKISFPWTMIDKITPRPNEKIEKLLKLDGIEKLNPIITSKNTYVAPFVNAEECEYLVIEDNFPNGRPELEKCGFLFTDKQTVDKVEKMKVCTCLNPLHTFLAIFGCLLNFNSISDEMKDKTLFNLVKKLGYIEGLPVVTDPKIIKPKDFIDQVVNNRLPNPFIPDTPQRIACDTSQKLSIRFGETIKGYLDSSLNVNDLQVIPLVFAGYLRYLMAIDDNGKDFILSADPLLKELCKYVEKIELGKSFEISETIEPLLKREDIFGVDLYKTNLAPKVIEYFKNFCSGIGAVRKTLESIK